MKNRIIPIIILFMAVSVFKKCPVYKIVFFKLLNLKKNEIEKY